MLNMLAQAASRPAVTPAPGTQFLVQLFPFLLIGLVFWFVVFRPRNVEQRKQQDMLKSLKKGDRVRTIGGILGTVVNVSEREVTLKVDESSNTKMTFIREAIHTVYSDAPAKP